MVIPFMCYLRRLFSWRADSVDSQSPRGTEGFLTRSYRKTEILLKLGTAAAPIDAICRRSNRTGHRARRRPLSEASGLTGQNRVLVIVDFGLAKLNAEIRRDLFEILEDRYAIRSTAVTSQLPVAKWHDVVGAPTLTNAILDRLAGAVGHALQTSNLAAALRCQPSGGQDGRGGVRCIASFRRDGRCEQ